MVKTRMYNPGRQKPLGFLGAWYSSSESTKKPVEIPLWDQNRRIVTRIVLEEASRGLSLVGWSIGDCG